jgi:MFS family permease
VNGQSRPATGSPPYLGAVFLGSTAFIFLNFGLPVRADDLGIDAVAIGGMYAVFTGTMLLIRPLVGVCLDRFGRRWFFTAAFLFYACAMSVFAASEGIADFYLARFLQGIGASLMWVTARTLVADVNIATERGAAMGRLTATSVRGSMIGATLGFGLLGFMPMREAWVLAFAGYALAACGALLWSLARVREPPVAEVDGELHDSLLALRRVRTAWSPALRRVLVVVFLSGFASALIEPVYLIYLKHKFDLGVLGLAVMFLPAGLVYAVLPRYAGQWSDRFGRMPVIATGVAFAGLVSMLLPLWPHIGFVAASYILFAVGWSMARPAEDALVADLAPPGRRGAVMGAREAAAGLGMALGPLVGGAIYEHGSQSLAFVLNGVLLLATAALAVYWFRSWANPSTGRDPAATR